MQQGPTIIYDKSAIQALSDKEADWLHHHFHAVLTPTLFNEVLGNLAKAPRDGRTAPDAVAALAEKIPNYAVTPNMHHYDLALMELFEERIQMSRRPYLGGGLRVKHSDGTVGVYIGEGPAEKALRKWKDRQFTTADREQAAGWRDKLASTDLNAITKKFSWFKADQRKLTTPEEILKLVNQTLSAQPYRMLVNALDYFDVPAARRWEVLERWRSWGRPSFDKFLPYCAHIVRVDMLFMFCVARGLISDGRASHAIDFTYFYYTPFAAIFTSNDKLHKRFAPLLLAADQIFLPFSELKDGLRALVDYYDALPKEKKTGGTMNYGRYPPVEGNYLVSNLYDRFIGNGWRIDANTPPPKRNPEEDKKLIDRIQKRLSEARAAGFE